MIQAGVMKALTGGDRISTRELHSSQIEFKPNAKIIMCTNKIPMMSDLDGGVLRRLKITEFVSRFVEEPNMNNEIGIYEFKIDKDLKSKLDNFKSVFMCILLDYYKIYRKEGLRPPLQVLQVTKKYENDNNIIKQFIDENLKTGEKTDFVTRDVLKDMFKADYVMRSTFVKFHTFIKQLENALCTEFKLDKKNVSKITGWRLKNPELDDDIDDDDDELD
jgi:phage/plasmid-associated DNA primase